MDTILIEDRQFEFLTEDFPRPSSYIRRFSQGSNRFYYTIGDDGNVQLYSSGTTLIKDGYAESEIYLEEWRNKLKSEGKNPKYELQFLALRGTLLHILAGDFIQQKEVYLGNLNEYFAQYHPEVTTEPLYYDVINKDLEWLVKGLLSFSTFCREFNVKPLAIELMMKSDKYMVASPIDLICNMDIEEKGFFGEVYKTGENKGNPKESKRTRTITAIVDLKSSQNGFYDKHFFQLNLYKEMVKENYPELNIEGLYNWSPKAWTGSEPTYNLKEQSSSKLSELCDVVFQQGAIKHKWKTPTVDVSPATLKFGEVFEYKKVELTEYLKELHGERNNS